MEDSATFDHQNRKKRNREDFGRFWVLPDDGASQEANPPGLDRAYKTQKPNSDVSLPETAPNLPNSSPPPKPNMGSEDLHHSTPSPSSKHSPDSSRPSPSSTCSKSLTAYEALDGKNDQNQTSSPVRKWKEDQIELGLMESVAAEQLAKRSKVGEIYKAIAVHRESIVKRLKDLCNEEPTIGVGIEMADAACLLKLMSFSTNEIESAGQKAHKGAMLLLQAEILHKNGLKLLDESQNSLGGTLRNMAASGIHKGLLASAALHQRMI